MTRLAQPGRGRAAALAGLAAASWINLALITTWRGIRDPYHEASIGGRVSAEAYWAAILVVLLVALTVALFSWWSAALPPRLRTVIGDAALLFAAGPLAATLWRENGGLLTTVHVNVGARGAVTLLLFGTAAASLAALAVRNWRWCMRAARSALLILSPFLFFTVGRAVFLLAVTDFDAFRLTLPAKGLATPRAGPRVIVVVFDELDYTFAFTARPPTLRLPTFDRLRSESVFLTDVVPPAPSTELALPSYLMGRSVERLAWKRPSSRGIQFKDESTTASMETQSTIFHDAARLGARSELVGFSLPYCRWAFATLLERCTWRPITWGGVFDGPIGLPRAIVRQFLSPLVVGNRREHIGRIEELTTASVRAVADSTLRLVFLHLPVPHLPPVWNVQEARYSLLQVKPTAYFDNLALTDDILSRLRAAIDGGATSERTFLIVTSDHPWRSGPIDGRTGGGIPFIVRTPSLQRIEVTRRVDAIRLRDLTAALLDGSLKTGTEVSEWLTSAK